MNKQSKLQWFTPETPETGLTGLTVKQDIEPAISIDHINRLSENITELQKLLGITEMEHLAAGSQIKIYKTTVENNPDQVGEGETIGLTKVSRKLAKTIDLVLKKYRKATSAETIQKSGKDKAVNETDAKLLLSVQKDIRTAFYAILATGTGTATGTGLQAALANAWGKIANYYNDFDATPIFFVNPTDVAAYLGTASISTQNVFGFTYIKNFLGLGDAILTPNITAGTFYATAKENLNGAYAGQGDVAEVFGLTMDQTGMVGMTHQVVGSNATLETLVMSGVVFYPEALDGVFKGTITKAA